MKDGDFIYCKKSYFSTDEFGIEEWITEGKCYEVVHEKDFDIYSIIDNDGDINNTLAIPNFLKEHFYTEQEYRKFKLKKLNGLHL